MPELMINLVTLGLGFFTLTGPVLVLMAALKRRDEKEGLLYARILGQLNAPDLRGLYTVRFESRPFGPDTVHIDLWGCLPQRVWEVMLRISESLPSGVKLEVGGVTESRPASTWSLTLSKRCPALPACPV